MLNPGTRFGAYEVVSLLGAGGMGEVYKATDTKLGRAVAIKILPPAFGGDPERLGRFQREAQLLAALNHPRIGAIYGLEESAGTQFLVLELVEGETLADRLARGRMPVDDALAVAREVIDALEAAHEKGIIHRDLKPSNIALTSDGHVKVLDFGLAKALAPAGTSSDGARGELTHSPTLTLAATQAGVILGTAAYMSPEQAKGRAADRRSDVWAFGCVLFEMLSGTRAFEGEDVSDTMAAVLRGEPSWDALPADVPPAVRTLLRRCLEKDRRTRIPDVTVFRFLMDDADAAALSARTAPAVAPAPVAPSRRAGSALPWAVAAAALVLAGAAVVGWAPWRAAPDRPTVRLLADIGADATLDTDLGSAATLSPDGQVVVFVAAPTGDSRSKLYVRRLGQMQATPLGGTEGATTPFFSQDGQWIGFFAGGKMKKIAVTGGAAISLTDASGPRGATWMPDDSIVFTPSAAGALFRVPSAGGKAEPFTKLAGDDTLHRWPDALPGGRVLFTAGSGGGFSAENASVNVRDPDGTMRVLVRGAYYGRYAASGHIVYMTNGAMFAAPFDAKRGVLTGEGVPVLESVASSNANGTTHFAISASGTVVYVPGDTVSNDAPITWVDESGKTQPLRATASNWSNPEFAQDGRRLAVDISDGAQADIWIYEWARDTLSRLTFDTADDLRPVWTRDGSRIAYSSRRADKLTFNLYWQRADGTGEVQRLTESKNQQTPASFHPSGKFLAYDELTPTTNRDIWILPLEGDEATGWKAGKPYFFLQTPQLEGSAMFSPDGRWIAYLSNETGRNEIYVRPFPGPGGKWQISTGAADDPTWSPDGRRIFFASTVDSHIMAAPFVAEGSSFRADKPTLWSDARFVGRPRPPSRDFAIHPDGKRFAAASSSEPQAQAQLSRFAFVFNFFDELRRVTKAAK